MKILNKISDCIFTTQIERKYSEKKLSEQEKVDRKINLLRKYLQEDTAHEHINHEIHKLIKQIETEAKAKS
jgi:flagellar biosynthesis protein FliP